MFAYVSLYSALVAYQVEHQWGMILNINCCNGELGFIASVQALIAYGNELYLFAQTRSSPFFFPIIALTSTMKHKLNVLW